MSRINRKEIDAAINFLTSSEVLNFTKDIVELHYKLILSLTHGRPLHELEPRDQLAMQKVTVRPLQSTRK